MVVIEFLELELTSLDFRLMLVVIFLCSYILFCVAKHDDIFGNTFGIGM